MLPEYLTDIIISDASDALLEMLSDFHGYDLEQLAPYFAAVTDLALYDTHMMVPVSPTLAYDSLEISPDLSSVDHVAVLVGYMYGDFYTGD